LFAGFDFIANLNLAGLVIPDQYDGQTGFDAPGLQCSDTVGDLLAQQR